MSSACCAPPLVAPARVLRYALCHAYSSCDVVLSFDQAPLFAIWILLTILVNTTIRLHDLQATDRNLTSSPTYNGINLDISNTRHVLSCILASTDAAHTRAQTLRPLGPVFEYKNRHGQAFHVHPKAPILSRQLD